MLTLDHLSRSNPSPLKKIIVTTGGQPLYLEQVDAAKIHASHPQALRHRHSRARGNYVWTKWRRMTLAGNCERRTWKMNMVGDRLRDVRQSQHLSLTTVAAKAKISAATLSRIETSKQALDLGLFLNLARILKVSPRDLIGEQEEQNDDPQIGRLASLDATRRAKFWRELAAARREQRNNRRANVRQLGNEVEELLAQLDFMREEIESVRIRLKKRR